MQIMPDLKPIKIATQGVAKDFRESLVPAVIRSLGYVPTWSTPANCDLLIYGPFFENKKKKNWVPKPLRPILDQLMGQSHPKKRTQENRPLSLFITGENIRHDFQNCDFAISFDLGICSSACGCTTCPGSASTTAPPCSRWGTTFFSALRPRRFSPRTSENRGEHCWRR